MRMRMVKPEFWTDEGCAQWPAETRLAYIALWNEADDAGRIRCNWTYLRSALFPYSPRLDMGKTCAPLLKSGKILTYEAEGQQYGILLDFHLHQRIDRPSRSRLPAPPEKLIAQVLEHMRDRHGRTEKELATIRGLLVEEWANARRGLDEDSTNARRALATSRARASGKPKGEMGSRSGNGAATTPSGWLEEVVRMVLAARAEYGGLSEMAVANCFRGVPEEIGRRVAEEFVRDAANALSGGMVSVPLKVLAGYVARGMAGEGEKKERAAGGVEEPEFDGTLI